LNIYKDTSRIIVTCNKRLGPYVQQEIEELGFKPENVFITGVELKGTMLDCIRLNLHLRCASQVHFSIKRFKANSPDEVYREVSEIPWEKIIPKDGYFSVTNTVDHPTVKNTMFLNVKVKDAIVDRIRQETGKRPDSGSSLESAVVHIYWKDTWAEMFIDTSGETLAKHGYRKIPGKAPMLEALAAASVYATRWDRQSTVVNPMCGSGTVAIEAALIATNRFPGLLRTNYSFMHFTGYDKKMYEEELEKLQKKVKEVPSLAIVLNDLSKDAINVAKTNATYAGVASYMIFEQGDFEETEVPDQHKGIVFFNPEYGERLGDAAELEATYKRMGDFLKKKCKGYTGYIFTGNLDLAKKIGLRASRRIEFYNAKIDCRLLEYELYEGTKRQ
jgi:23S rRNA G2445 N2-methylase RlmL